MIQRLLTSVSRVPELWNGLRWLAEAGYLSHHKAIRGALDPFRADSRRFLDFGCGTGQFAAQFPAGRYVGIDPERAYTSYAAEHRRGTFVAMDGGELGLQDRGFDGALVLGVLHHLPDELVRRSMQELHRVLKPAATLLVIEDVPPPTIWNVPGHIMHWLDRGNYIRSDQNYRALFAPYFEVQATYSMRSGICDYGVYVLSRQPQPATV